ncbi:hypothetical protein DBZ36_16330 [Alginatibacterium sediminis]|uniref:Uncharacterized protein n=1 Tax=Alginatibacterium sediminis TaxID=2164068 RepID=A0A420E992_9ALTE|nr:hypothetical protein [Alginatibacterium sediminis]RKF15931.1 hypothetical protein DBZ36_16330 [Alginatibacterium sediminis]
MRKSTYFVVFVIVSLSPLTQWAQASTGYFSDPTYPASNNSDLKILRYKWASQGLSASIRISDRREYSQLQATRMPFTNDDSQDWESWLNYEIDDNIELEFRGNKLKGNYDTKFEPFCNDCKLQLQSTVWRDGDIRLEFKSPFQ